MTNLDSTTTIVVLTAPDAAKPAAWYRQQLADRDTCSGMPENADLVIAPFHICDNTVASEGVIYEQSAAVSSLIAAVFNRAYAGENVMVVMDLGAIVTWDEIARYFVSRRMPLHTLTVAEIQPQWYKVTDGRPTKGSVHLVRM